jgi:hypothetical protein
MRRQIVALVFVLLAACAAPAPVAPTASPPPSRLALPTMPPAGATVLSSDFGKTRPTIDPTVAARLPTPLPTDPPAPTPVAAGFDYALRSQFSQELNKIENKTYYSIQWDVSDDLTEIHARQRIGFANRTDKALDGIYLRLFANATPGEGGIEINQVTIGGRPANIELSQNDTVAHLTWGNSLAPGRVLVATIDYTVKIPKDGKGRYSDFTQTDWLTTLPTIYPIIPAFDDKGWHLEMPPEYGDVVYADSSTFDVTINTPADYEVIASGEMVQEIRQGNRISRRFIAAPMRDFNANLTNVLENTSAQLDDVTVTSWYKPNDAEAGKRALEWAVNAMRVYEKRFGPYPFRSLDIVESPTTAGGIEYPGVITVASNLYQDPGQLSFFEFATAHEVAHQWFYSVVGSDQVNHPWLDEALAQYATTMYFEDHYDMATAQQIRNDYFQTQYDRGKQKFGNLPAGLPVEAYSEDAYGAFVYGKGPLFFQAVRTRLGDAAFFKALQNYYRQFKYTNAQPQDLVNAFNQAGGQDITPLYQEWIGN